MSGSFLSRWSRRKQEARRPEHRPEPVDDEGRAGPAPEAEAFPPADQPAEPALSPEELAELPKIEELTAETDISAFLRKGVPDALRNAALRRMWLLDPAIRDFVGEARDYAYDWNTPGGVPGSGELPPGEDVQTMLRQVFGEPEPGKPELDQSRVEASRVRDRAELPTSKTESHAAVQQARPEEADRADMADESDREKGSVGNTLKSADRRADPAAPQQAGASPSSDAAASPRHGGAKPV
jgi:hypothetical protein